MKILDRKARSQILHMLCEGNSIRAVTRLTGVSKNTVIKLLNSWAAIRTTMIQFGAFGSGYRSKIAPLR